MYNNSVIERGSVFQTDLTVTVLEPGKRRITFFKNTQTCEIKLLTDVTGATKGGERRPRGLRQQKHDHGAPDYQVRNSSGLYHNDDRTVLPADGNGASPTSIQSSFQPPEHAAKVASTGVALGEYVCECFGILGIVKFTEGCYLVVVTDAHPCGSLFMQHGVYSIRGKTLVSLHHPCSNRYIEEYYHNMFNHFDITDHFYFSYTYNICNSLQLNRMYGRCSEEDLYWLGFDSTIETQKYWYNFSHAKEFGDYFGKELEPLCLHMIHGFFGQATICVSGRNIILHLIARRSRFYAGTRYRKRGITAKGHVANEVETEQILEDVTCTGSIFSFVQLRGSTPTFWAQNSNQNIMTKPPVSYPQYDPTFTATRLHIADLLCLYGAPLIMLNLLSDDPTTEEGQLSQRYEEAVKAINLELPPAVRTQYVNRNIRGAFERGCVRNMIAEIIEHAANELGYFHERSQQTLNLQVGVLRASCLDCLDRTSVVAMHLGSLVFQNHLKMLGLLVQNCDISTEEERQYTPCYTMSFSEELASKNGMDPVVELFRNMFVQLGDAVAMQYAGSKTLRKYEGAGGAFSISLQLLTTIKRRYYSHFADSERQTLSNIFLGVLKADEHPPPWTMDLDNYIHHELLKCSYNNLDWWVLPLTCYLKRARKMMGTLVNKPWFELFDDQGEYRPWVLLAQLLPRKDSEEALVEEMQDPYKMEINISLELNAVRNEEVLYTSFKEMHLGEICHINRDNDNECDFVTPPSSTRYETGITHLASMIETMQSPRVDEQRLGITEPDIGVISTSLQPWKITEPEDVKVLHDVTSIKCREADLRYYRRFIDMPSLGQRISD